MNGSVFKRCPCIENTRKATPLRRRPPSSGQGRRLSRQGGCGDSTGEVAGQVRPARRCPRSAISRRDARPSLTTFSRYMAAADLVPRWGDRSSDMTTSPSSRVVMQSAALPGSAAFPWTHRPSSGRTGGNANLDDP
jgi:hypothetical protein